METKLDVRNLVVSFRTPSGKVQAVRDISFTLNKGETLAIVGESGSGKSVTSKAILGILANNAIVEGGEIIYEGQDLLQIEEEEFHKLRGDKIAMIFQDPLSALNPIIRIGVQLTEAMLLKNKSNRRNCRRDFNNKLALLNNTLNEYNKDNVNNNAKCKMFDKFCIATTKLEGRYNAIYRVAYELKLDAEEVAYLLSKKQKVEVAKKNAHYVKELARSVHPDIVVKDAEYQAVVEQLNSAAQLVKQDHTNVAPYIEALNRLSKFLEVCLAKTKPNYFTLGYFTITNPTVNVDDMDINELNTMTRKYLDDNFMIDFRAIGSEALQYAMDKSVAAKKEVLVTTDAVLEFFRQETIDKNQTKAVVKDICGKVETAINRLEVKQNSIETTFASSLRKAVKQYFDAINNNPKEIARYEKQNAKWQALVAKGKDPTWKVTPANVLDEQLALKNIRSVIHRLRALYRDNIEAASSYDCAASMVELIDYLKEKASGAVYVVTRKMARASAIKMMHEVGIPEPEKRYRQYPFQFSGGMRQRIVIAIALVANPDILICDEPTTALDVTIQAQILELINKLKQERHLSVIFITHDMGVVANMADRIAIMYAGKIVEQGTCEEVFYDPRHPYSWALLASMPDLDTEDKLESIPGTPPNMIYPPVGDAFAERSKYAMEIDFEQQPPMFEISPTHSAATWLLHPDAPKVKPPKIILDRIARNKKLTGGGKK